MSSLPKTLGKYQIRSILGQGAMGVVYEGFDPDIERTVAVKVLHQHLVDTTEGNQFKQRFRREAQAAAKCFHPNIVTVFEFGHEGDRDFIAMEYVQGEELKYFLDSGNQFDRAETALIVTEVLKALSAAHSQGVVHRDIKPANIILLDDGSVKVADFGVARLDNSDLTMAGNMVGTPSYMAPEGLRGESVDLKADIYSASMVLLELVTGRKPHPKELYVQTISQFLDQVFSEHQGEAITTELESVIRKGLSDDKANRYESAGGFMQALKSAIAEIKDDQQIIAEKLSETVINQKPLHKSVVEPATVEWDEEILHELELGLASYIGPLAKVLVQRSSSANTTPEELISSLAGHIPDPDEKAAFLKKAKKCISGNCTHDSTASGAIVSLSESLTAEQLNALSRKLAFYLGPLATQIVAREAKKHTEMEVFCQELAASIPSGAEREAFLKSVCV